MSELLLLFLHSSSRKSVEMKQEQRKQSIWGLEIVTMVMLLLAWTFLWPFVVVVKRRIDILILIQFIVFNSHWTHVGIHSAYGTWLAFHVQVHLQIDFESSMVVQWKAATIVGGGDGGDGGDGVVTAVEQLSGRDRNQEPRKQWWRKITKPFEKISHCFRSRSTEPSSALLSNITFRRVCLCQSQMNTHTNSERDIHSLAHSLASTYTRRGRL